MPKGLSYLDAVKILGGSGPLAKVVDNLLGGALSAATLGGSDAALSFFDAKAEMVRLGGLVTTRITDVVRGLGRYNRTERLLAASGVLVVAALFEALDDCFRTAGLEPAEFSGDDKLTLVDSPLGPEMMLRLLDSPIPAPAPSRTYAELLDELRAWYGGRTDRLATHVSGLAVLDDADETTRARVLGLIAGSLAGRAADRYDEHHRRLAEEIPEFAIWSGRLEARATAQSLRRLEQLLVRASAGRDPSRHRAALARAYRAKLDRPVFAGDAGDLVLPHLGDAYVDPFFQVKEVVPGSLPANESWWDGEVRTDFHAFLATYLTTAGATETPLLLLGQPGAGKSSLTHIVAARLPASDYLVTRVPLREVPAEEEIQDQIELAVRRTIGETVAWAEMAEDAEQPLSVVLLDGFDELLQATGVHQSDYLSRVAAFQERELAQGRPVAVIVTSRVAVADRARIPQGALVVRLEPFAERQIEQWLDVWNRANPSIEPLRSQTLSSVLDLAGQPLLLLMLALHHGAGHSLSEHFDSAELYERLLSEFAHREVRRLHAGRPESAMPGLVEAELLRLSVVAFAMFHRNRLWITEQELDDDLAGLGLTPSAGLTSSAGGASGGRHTPLTAAEEMIGRFFFIQRAQAVRDTKTFRTYEFLHATFGEYLVARLVVRVLRDTAARERATTLALQLGAQPEADLLQDLLVYTPLTSRTTILPFVRALLDAPGHDDLGEFLVHRTRQAVTRPQYTPGRYRPIDKRIDHCMATYSFNLTLLTLTTGRELPASQLYTEANDPADWLRGTALQWRAALPGGMYLDALETIAVHREMRDGRRDIVLSADPHPPLPSLEPAWSNRRYTAESDGYPANFPWGPVLNSMHLSNNLSDDTLLHAMEPLIFRLPQASRYHVVQDSGETESVAHSLIELWLTSGLGDDPDRLATVYRRATRALSKAVGYFGDAPKVATVLLRSLRNDATRLDPGTVVELVDAISRTVVSPAHITDAVRCLVAPGLPGAARLDLLAALVRRLLDVAPDDQPVHRVLALLAEAGDLPEVLERVGVDLAQPYHGRLTQALQAHHPDLLHLLDR